MLGALSRSILTLCCTESCSKERFGCGRSGRLGIGTGLGSARTRTSRQVALQVGSVYTGGLKSLKDNHRNISERNEQQSKLLTDAGLELFDAPSLVRLAD